MIILMAHLEPRLGDHPRHLVLHQLVERMPGATQNFPISQLACYYCSDGNKSCYSTILRITHHGK